MIMTAVYTLRLARKKKMGERISPVRVAYCLVYATEDLSEIEKLQDSQNGREKWVASATAAAIDAIHRMRSIAPIAMLLARSNHSDDYETGKSSSEAPGRSSFGLLGKPLATSDFLIRDRC